ncbi:DUF4118 domain-containing protein [Homoserinibacter sp. YIM 151385]|uniref:DUF4118 domain-containing protein n=1 Tax=Homoserinibacter sp. YIM 151385 TaxID=2985506 RepID=UPI0022F059A9|nr:DUF4118 domain-containing protein [Homoserinibacter sp. YIM 151385]WBU37130.1 DUF4118 domain-containing protein [Homoserinibacter sp. YIM 151385]
MGRGRLRVLLGAAPGVGKTYTMLEEGRRLRAAGVDVVVGVVETHGRAATAALVEGLELVPRRRVEHRGVVLEELDLDAVIARAPQLALVDELAHTNAPGSAHAKRWGDVEALLDAGIDVISTVNIQHITSLGDVVTQITGVVQRETIPDDVLRRAEQIELIDLAPQALRDRLAQGVVYPAARIDAALSNYFRLGNLTALRELALLWLADEVDSALQRYRAEQGIDAAWEARERVVVALTGGAEGETLLRRGARIAARSGKGQLVAVHVASPDGLQDADAARLAEQADLARTLGGSYHRIVAEDVAAALVEFARASNATQLVIGVSRRSRVTRLLGGSGTSSEVIRRSGDIDVHIVTHAEAGAVRRWQLPKIGGALAPSRLIAGFALTLLGLPALTWALVRFRSEATVVSDVLLLQLFVVVVALAGGIWPALLAAIAAGVVFDYFFVLPYSTLAIDDPLHALALAIFVAVAVLVSIVVDRAARRARVADRARAEAEVLVSVAGAMLRGGDALGTLVDRLREAFGMASVLLRQDGRIAAAAKEPERLRGDDEETEIPLGAGASLYLRGRPLSASDRRILGAFVAQLEGALEQRRLQEVAAEAAPIAEADRLRSALLAAVGHDLRRPLAAATAAVGSLRTSGAKLTKADRSELLETADESLASLGSLVTDLLDASRLQAGVLGVALAPVALEELVVGALDELGLAPGDVELRLDETPSALADAALARRAIVNILANALRFAPEPPVVATSAFAGRVQLRVVDTGPGVPEDELERIFLPFQRRGDLDNTAGVGLGLALSRGFAEAMGGAMHAEPTPGGGLTLVLDLPAAERGEAAA